MTKSDLKDGMVVETRNGKRHLFINGKMLEFDGFFRLESYSENLKSKVHKDYDIVKIYESNEKYSLKSIFKDEHLTLIWEREEIELTDREVEILKALKLLGFEWLSRDINGSLYAYEVKHYTEGSDWLNVKHKDVFNFITCEDEEFTKIDDLLKVVS